MKEPYTEEVATHGGPEPCVDVRKGVGEALAEVRIGEVSSREIIPLGCRRGSGPGRQHDQARHREHLVDSTRSKTLCMHETLHAREPGDPSYCPRQMETESRGFCQSSCGSKAPGTPWRSRPSLSSQRAVASSARSMSSPVLEKS